MLKVKITEIHTGLRTNSFVNLMHCTSLNIFLFES